MENELASHANRNMNGRVNGDGLEHQAGAAVRFGIVEIRQCGGSEIAADTGIVWLPSAIISLGDDQTCDHMESA